jgi:16S rRNA (uracil1498-N3)-methyltransferase
VDDSGHGVLDPDEAAHVTRVLRLGTGAEIDVVDGRGGTFHARIVEVSRGRVRVRVEGTASAAAEPGVRVTLVMSVIKGDRMDEVVRDATMMGVAAIQPVVATRSEVSVATVARAHRRERWQRIAVSAMKQCGRATLPPVHEPVTLERWLGSPEAAAPVLVLTEPAVGAGSRFGSVPRSAAATLLVGPEGGWTPDEAAAFAAAGFQFVALGGRTLRADAVPLVAMAALFEAWLAW